MKLLLLGYGVTIQSIEKILKKEKIEYIIATNNNELKDNFILLDKNLLKISNEYLVLKSPGIKKTDDLIIKLKEKFTFINELDLLQILNKKIKVIAVTGSNGKTTCVNMINSLLLNANYKSIVCGNSHKPIFDYYDILDTLDFLVVELSSFQLDDMKYFHPYISTILNLSQNHLDAVNSLEDYYNSKKNIYKYQVNGEYFLLNNNYKNYLNNINKEIVYPLNCIIDYNLINSNNRIYNEQLKVCKAIVEILNINDHIFYKTINDFKSLPYRNNIKIVNEYKFINDAKSTNVESTNFSINIYKNEENLILIIGGKDKLIDYHKINLSAVKYIFVYGEIRKYFKNNTIFKFPTLNECFNKIINLNFKKMTVLFSPATSSFDQYKNFIERGIEFDNLVNEYQKKVK